MAIRVDERDGSPVRHVLVGMAISKAVCAAVAPLYRAELLPAGVARTVAGWCVEHYKKYGTAPGAALEYYFGRWAEDPRWTRDERDAVERFLVGLSADAARLKQRTSPAHLIDVAAATFNKTGLADLNERVAACLDVGDVDKALDAVAKFRRVEIGTGAGVSLFGDFAPFEAMFARRAAPVVTFPGALGDFFGSRLCRDQLVAILGHEKSGKSFFLQALAWAALEQGQWVAYFECGDSSQPQVLERFAARIAGRPLKAGRYELPDDIDPSHGEKKPVAVATRWHVIDDDLTEPELRSHWDRWRADLPDPDLFKLHCAPADTLSVGGVETILDTWRRDGWAADGLGLVCIDYADLLAPPDRRQPDKRERVNDTWVALRAMAAKLHCLVVTPTQTNRVPDPEPWVLTRDHVGEYHRKLTHVFGMCAINRTRKEADNGRSRLNWVTGRDLDFPTDKCVFLAGNLAYANPWIKYTF